MPVVRSLTSSRIKDLKDLKILVLIALAPFAALIVFCELSSFIDKYPIEIFDLGQGKSLSILTKSYWEVNRPLYFEVREGFFKVVNDGCLIDFDSPDWPNDSHQYAFVFAENRSMVGVLDFRPVRFSSPLVIMCDLVSNKCWPCDTDHKERENFFERLLHDNPNLSRPWGLSP